MYRKYSIYLERLCNELSAVMPPGFSWYALIFFSSLFWKYHVSRSCRSEECPQKKSWLFKEGSWEGACRDQTGEERDAIRLSARHPCLANVVCVCAETLYSHSIPPISRQSLWRVPSQFRQNEQEGSGQDWIRREHQILSAILAHRAGLPSLSLSERLALL